MGTTLQRGDILIVNRVLYKHFGIYAGNGAVIHYAAINGDFGDDICIHEAPLERFAHEDEIIVGRFSESFMSTHTVYGPEETLTRARSRIGERQYNLVTNNCEHFALWCKTGESQSFQVNVAAGALALFVSAIGSILNIDDMENAGVLTDAPSKKFDEMNNLGIAPVEKTNELSLESVISFFKDEKRLNRLRCNTNLSAVVIKHGKQVILCLFDQQTQSMDGSIKIYEPGMLASSLKALFGEKNMIVLE